MFEFIWANLLIIAGSFEIKVNGKLVFSKLKLGGFPNAEDVSDLQH